MESPESISAWLVKGRVIMLPKSDETHDPSRFRPIACGIVASRIKTYLNTHNIMYLEQQRAMKNSYGCKRELFINKSIMEHAVKARRNMSMAFIDY